MKRVVTIGGGSSSFAILRGLKAFPFDITAVVNMFDSGGSSGILRDEFGVLPPGDVRRALLALSEGDQAEILRQLFNYRFNGGTGLSGHNFGNLLIVALGTIYGGEAQGIEKAGELLNIKGTVLPVSLDKADVHARLENGEEIVGETNIDIPKHDGSLRITEVSLQPLAHMYEKTDRAIREADLVVLCPGDLYSSIVPTLLTEGMRGALEASHAKKVWVCNLMTKWGETQDFDAAQYAQELLRYSGIQKFDAVVWNTREIPHEAREAYARSNQFPVQLDEERLMQYTDRIVKADILSEADIVRHDSDTIAHVLAGL